MPRRYLEFAVSQPKRALALVLCAAVLSSITLLVIATSGFGVGVNTDSVVYLEMATSARHGQGMTIARPGGRKIITVYPPGYPGLLALLGSSAKNIHSHVRAANTAMWALFLIASSWLAFRLSDRNLLAALAAACLLGGNFVFLGIFALAISEVPFLVVVCLALIPLVRLREQESMAATILSATGLGLSCLLRFAGAGIVLAVAVWHLLLSPGTARARAVRAGVTLCIGAIPAVALLGYQELALPSSSSRHLGWHLPSASAWAGFAEAIRLWAVPVALPEAAARTLAVLLTGAMLVLFASQVHGRIVRKVVASGSLFTSVATIYFGFVLAVITVLYEITPLSTRILVPALFAATMLVAVAGARVADRRPVAALLALALLVGPQFARATAWSFEARASGLHWNKPTWTESSAVQLVEHLSPQTEIFANRHAPVRWATGADVFPLAYLWTRLAQPDLVVVWAHTVNLDRDAEFEEMRMRLAAKGMILRRVGEDRSYTVFRVEPARG